MSTESLRTLPAQLRRQLEPLLPERAFLRRDRGDHLFVTNAPQFADGSALIDQCQACGFICTLVGHRLHLSPGPEILTQLEQQHEPPDFLTRSLLPLRGLPPCPESVVLFSKGIQLLENADPGRRTDYARQVRQLAALCLRTRQGGAYACALIDHTLQTERSTAI